MTDVTRSFTDDLKRAQLSDISIVVPQEGESSKIVPATPDVTAFIKSDVYMYQHIDPATGHIALKDFQEGVVSHLAQVINASKNEINGTSGKEYLQEGREMAERWVYDPNARAIEQQGLISQLEANGEKSVLADRLNAANPALDTVVQHTSGNWALQNELPMDRDCYPCTGMSP